MNSRIFHGETTHRRRHPTRHAFRYPMFWFAIDLDELARLDREVAFFGYNRRSVATIHDRDYGGTRPGTIRDKIECRLREAGVPGQLHRITLLTIPRILGYVFNPVSFYLCDDRSGRLMALCAEVRNTFGEMHHYVSLPEDVDPGAASNRFVFSKEFYVSPFFDTDGCYEVHLEQTGERFQLTVRLVRKQQLVFVAAMRGRGRSFTTSALVRTLFRYPVFAATIMLRIKWQAAQLYFRRRLTFVRKPEPTHPSTSAGVRTSMWHRLRRWIIHRARCTTSPDCPSPSATESELP